MKILVPFKSVPDPNDARVPGAAASTAKSVINPFDEIAIEEALRIHERGDAAEIVGVTDTAPTPTGFADVVSDQFPVPSQAGTLPFFL